MVRKVARNRTGNEWRQGSCSFWPFGGGGRVLPPPFYFLSSSINPETCNFSQHSLRPSVHPKERRKGWTMDYRCGCEVGLGVGEFCCPHFRKYLSKWSGDWILYEERLLSILQGRVDKMYHRSHELACRKWGSRNLWPILSPFSALRVDTTREIRLGALYATRGN